MAVPGHLGLCLTAAPTPGLILSPTCRLTFQPSLSLSFLGRVPEAKGWGSPSPPLPALLPGWGGGVGLAGEAQLHCPQGEPEGPSSQPQKDTGLCCATTLGEDIKLSQFSREQQTQSVA